MENLKGKIHPYSVFLCIGFPCKRDNKSTDQLLVHPKDQIATDQKYNVISEKYRARNRTIGHNQEEGTARRFTRTQKQTVEQENLKSAITDHCRKNTHIMDWDKGKVITSETNKLKRWMKEAIEMIRRRVSCTINRQEGAYTLSQSWDSLLQRPSKVGEARLDWSQGRNCSSKLKQVTSVHLHLSEQKKLRVNKSTVQAS